MKIIQIRRHKANQSTLLTSRNHRKRLYLERSHYDLLQHPIQYSHLKSLQKNIDFPSNQRNVTEKFTSLIIQSKNHTVPVSREDEKPVEARMRGNDRRGLKIKFVFEKLTAFFSFLSCSIIYTNH